MTKIYISGPMTGYPDDNYPAFFAEEERLIKLGYEVLNPARLPKQKDWNGYMRESIKMLMDADEVVMLRGYNMSKGARIEKNIAERLDMKIIFREG